MLDNKEIALRSLRRADEIKAEINIRSRRRRRIVYSAAGVGVAAFLLVAVMKSGGAGSFSSAENLSANNAPLVFDFLIPQIPLSTFYVIDVPVSIPSPTDSCNPFKFKITMRKSGETVYESEMIYPGTCVEKISVAGTLEEGIHEALLTVDYYDPENGGLIKSVTFELILESAH